MLGRLTRSNRLTLDPADAPFIVGGLAVVAVLLAVIAVMLDASALDVWTGLIVFLVLVAGSVPLLRWVARKEEDPWLFKVLFAALIVHLLFALIRYFVIFAVYKGNGDAGIYHEAGTIFARRVRDGVPVHPIELIQNYPIESQRIGDFVGLFYVITGPSAYAGFFLFTYLCYWGQLLVVRAFKVAVPEGDYRRLTWMVMFLPSLLFWPSSIGKESLMIACLGVIVYGGALLLCPRPKVRGGVFFVVGILLVLLIRPHVALMSIGGLGLALVVGLIGGFNTSSARTSRSGSDVDGGPSTRGRMLRLVGLVAVVVLAVVGSTRLGETLKDSQDGSAGGLEQALTQTARGGSEFHAVAIAGPTQFPAGFVTVLARPLPWEARNLNSMIAAAEGLVIIGLFAASWRRVLSLPRLAAKRPFLVFCATYVVLFVIAFSYISNFGILARQRVQVFPIVLVFLALPKSTARLLPSSRRRLEDGDEELADVTASVGTAVGASAPRVQEPAT